MTDLQQKPSSPQQPPAPQPPAATSFPPSPPPLSTESPSTPPSAPPNEIPPRRRFDPSRTIGIIKRKALIKDLAAVYHAECLSYCQELLELQRKCEEPYPGIKVATESRKEAMRPPKRLKKSR